MKTPRKRVPGGGRKRKPAREREGEWLTTRINPAIKARLEAEAQARGSSVSRTAKEILVLGLKELQKRERNDSMRGLGYLIGVLEEYCRTLMLRGPRSRFAEDLARLNWRAQPFIAQALKLAIIKLMDALVPEGDPNHIDGYQDGFGGTLRTPETIAEAAFRVLWKYDLGRATLESTKADFEAEEFYGDDQARNDWWRLSYRMIDARADLNIPQERFSQYELAEEPNSK